MSVNNGAALKVIKNQTREYTNLLHRYNTLMKVHVKAIDDCALIESKRYDLRKGNKELRKILKETQAECVVLQESLDHCQRELMEVEEARAITVDVPESWIIKDEELMDK